MTTLICKKGYITRRAYTRKNGTKVKAMCVKGNGKKKRSRKSRMRSKKATKAKAKKASKAKGIPPLKKGELTKHGYHNVKKSRCQGLEEKALTSAVKEYGASKVLEKVLKKIKEKCSFGKEHTIKEKHQVWRKSSLYTTII